MAARGPTDTIIALASGSGRAGIAVVRASGPGSAGLLAHFTGKPAPEPRHAAIRTLSDKDGGFIDEAIVLWMPGPNSYTGEDVVEFHVHGGAAVVEAVRAIERGVKSMSFLLTTAGPLQPSTVEISGLRQPPGALAGSPAVELPTSPKTSAVATTTIDANVLDTT